MSEQHHLEHQNKKTSFNLLLGTGIAFHISRGLRLAVRRDLFIL